MLTGSNAERLKSRLSPPHAFLSLRHAALDGAHSAIKIHCLFVLSNQHRIVITCQKKRYCTIIGLYLFITWSAVERSGKHEPDRRS
jgi:hypothetical protein